MSQFKYSILGLTAIVLLCAEAASARSAAECADLVKRFWLSTRAVQIGDIPDLGQISAQIHQRRYLVNGEIKEWGGDTEKVYSVVWAYDGKRPSPQRILLGSTPLMDGASAEAAAFAAKKAFDGGRGAWPSMTIEERIPYFERFLEKMIPQRETVVRFLMHEIGKTRADAETEFDRTVDYIRDTIKAARRLDAKGRILTAEEGQDKLERRIPHGVTLIMGPFNYPLNETFTTFIPALMMGNTTVFKPAKTGILLLEPLLDAFNVFPKGVVNSVYGDGQTVVTPIMKSGAIDVLAFIGSTQVANAIASNQSWSKPPRVVLGLGAKNPGIILAKDDLAEAVKINLKGACSFNGQRCTAHKLLRPNRLVADRFAQEMADAVDGMLMGHPWVKGVQLTALPDDQARVRMAEYIADALSKGARIINRLGGLQNNSFFFPAVLYPVTREMKIFWEEQFGPVIPIAPFGSIEELGRDASLSEYGQQASVVGGTVPELSQLADAMLNQVCRVHFNAACARSPDAFSFGGIRASAVGSLSIDDALLAFSEKQLWTEPVRNDGNKTALRKLWESGHRHLSPLSPLITKP